MDTNSRTYKAVRNAAWAIGAQGVNLALSFISRTVFIYYFGVEYLGLNGLFADVLGMLALADLGLNSAMVYTLYEPLARHDERRLAALVHFYRRIYLGIAACVFLLGLAMLPLLPQLVNTEADIPGLAGYFVLALASVSASYLFVYRTVLLTADQQGYLLTRINMATTTVKTLAQLLTMYIAASYALFLLLELVANIVNNILGARLATRAFPCIAERAELSRAEQRGIIRTIFAGFVYKVSSVLLNATDNLLISVLVSTAAVGYYSNYLLIQSKLTLLYSLVFTSLTASIGSLIVSADARRRYEVFAAEQTASSMLALVVIPCYLLLVSDFIRLWLGEPFTLDVPVLAAIGLNLYLACVLQPLWSYREATGLYRQTKYVMLGCAVLNLILSLAGGLAFGLVGILAASGLARLATYVWYEPVLLFRQFFARSPVGYFRDLAANALAVAVITVALAELCTRLPISSWQGWGLKALLLVAVCTAGSILVYHRKEGFKMIITKAQMYAGGGTRK